MTIRSQTTILCCFKVAYIFSAKGDQMLIIHTLLVLKYLLNCRSSHPHVDFSSRHHKKSERISPRSNTWSTLRNCSPRSAWKRRTHLSWPTTPQTQHTRPTVGRTLCVVPQPRYHHTDICTSTRCEEHSKHSHTQTPTTTTHDNFCSTLRIDFILPSK